jgi:iron(III) transport system permease protein
MILGAITASLSVIIGYIFSYMLTRTQTPMKGFFRMMATLPLISPPFMLTLSVILLFGKSGFITHQIFGWQDFNIQGLQGLVLVQTLSMFPIAYLTLNGVLSGLDSATEDAALDLGASKIRTFFDITLPLSAPGILSAWLLVFVSSLADFANPLMLAGKFDVLSVQAYLQFTGMNNLELGAALSNLLLVPCMCAYIIQKYYLSKKSFVTFTGKGGFRDRELTTPIARLFLMSFGLLVSLLIIALYVTVLAGCFTKAWGIDYSFSLENFKYVMDVGWNTIVSTTFVSVVATPFAGLFGILIAFLIVRRRFLGRKVLDIVAMLPFALPGTAVGIGYVLAFNQPPLLLTGTAFIIILCFIFRNMPVGIESAKSSLLQIDKSIEEAATNLGANTIRVFRDITLPMIKPATFASMAYVFVHCMTAVSAVIFLTSAQWNHMTVLILSQTEILRFSAASVLCLVLISIVLIAFWALKRFIGVNPMTKGAVS